MRTRTILLAGLALALAVPVALPTPAVAQVPPPEPAPDVFSHMTGSHGDQRLHGAVQDFVTGSVEDSLTAPAPDGQPAGAAEPWPVLPLDALLPPPQVPGGTPSGAVRSTGAPVTGAVAWLGAGPCERAGGTLAEVAELAGGQRQPLGVACVAAEDARADPYAAVRQQVRWRLRGIRLPDGPVTATPDEGLAWAPSRLEVSDGGRCPAELRVAAPRPLTFAVSCVVLAREWFFGDGTRARQPGAAASAEHTYTRAGRYAVAVRTVWAARATLEGRPFVTVRGLVSEATMTYPVAELRAVLIR